MNGNGGAIVNSNNYATFTFTNSSVRFNSNSASNGGAISNDSSATFTFSNSIVSFSSNSANNYRGGAIDNYGNANFAITNSNISFDSNSAVAGGAISNDNGAPFTFTNSIVRFSSNIAVRDGGAVNNYGNANLIFTNSIVSFNSNSADGGGAISNDNNATFAFSNSIVNFSSNIAWSFGGAIFNDSSATFAFTNSIISFTSNIASLMGGAIYADNNTNISFDRSTASFTLNYTPFGGALYSRGGSAISFTNSIINITRNSAYSGAAWYIVDSRIDSYNSSILFLNNTASNNGGAVMSSASNVNFISQSAYFTSNTVMASAMGGAIDTEFRNLFTFNDVKAFFDYNESQSSAGAIANNNSTMTFINSQASFNQNKAQTGGAIYSNASTMTLYNSTLSFYKHSVIDKGGAVFLDNRTYLFSDDNSVIKFDNNVSATSGGAVFIGGLSQAVLNGLSIFNENTAKWGGAVFISANNSLLSIRGNAEFNNNIASSSGGAVFVGAGGRLSSNNSAAETIKFKQNNAPEGGAIYMRSQSSIRTEFDGGNVIFEANTAYRGGAVFLNAISTMVFRNANSVEFVSNIASTGAAIYIANNANARIYFYDLAVLSFKTNISTNSDGIIFWLNNDPPQPKIVFSGIALLNVQSNKALNGGFIALNNRQIEVSADRYDYSKNTAIANTDSKGGVYYLTNNSSVTIRGGGIINANTAYMGGFVYADMGSSVNFVIDTQDLLSTNNKALQGMGGDIHLDAAVLNFNAYSGNTARFSGGGVYAFNRSYINSFGQGSVYLGGIDYFTDLSSFGIVNAGIFGTIGSTFTYIRNDKGIYAGASTISFNSSSMTFVENNSNDGAALYAYRSNVSFNGVKALFIFNNALNSGGAVFSTNSRVSFIGGTDVRFTSNSASQGGSIFLIRSSLSFVRAKALFQYNTADHGAAIAAGDGLIYSQSVINSSGSQIDFIDNTALNSFGQGGAAVFFDGFNKAQFNYSNLLFLRNIAYRGGAVVLSTKDAMNFSHSNVSFRYNTADNDGGAAVILSQSIMSFSDSVVDFTSNTAVQYGGAVFVDPSDLSFLHSTVRFIRNTALRGGSVYLISASTMGSVMSFFDNTHAMFDLNTAQYGGAVYIENSNIDFSASLVEFTNNTADRGAAIYVDGGQFRSVLDKRSKMSFVNNTVSEFGGAVFAQGGVDLNLSAVAVEARNNFAPLNGGFFYIRGSGVSISSVHFGDLLVENNNADPFYLVGGKGGGLYIENASVFIGNRAQNDIFFRNNKAQYGGAVYMKNARLDLNALNRDIVFRDNEAEVVGNGNDIYMDGGSILSVNAVDPHVVDMSGGITGYLRSDTINKAGNGTWILSGVVNYNGEFNILSGEVKLKSIDPEYAAKVGNLNLINDRLSSDRVPRLTMMSDAWNFYIAQTNNFNLNGIIDLGINVARGVNDIIETTGTVVISSGLFDVSGLVVRAFGAIGKEDFEIIVSPYFIEGEFRNMPEGRNDIFKTNYTISYNVDGYDGHYAVVLGVDSKSDFINNIPGMSHNQKEAASVFDNMTDSKKMPLLVTALSDAAIKEYDAADGKFTQTRKLLEQLSGSFLANVLPAGAQNHSDNLYAKIREIDAKDEKRKSQTIWVQADIDGFSYDSDSSLLETLKQNGLGMQAGIAMYQENKIIGGAYFGFHSEELKQGDSYADISDLEIGLYGGWYSDGPVNIKGNASLGFQSFDVSRHIQYQQFEENPQSSFNTYSVRFNAIGEYKIFVDNEINFKPYLGLQNALVINNEIRESNAVETALIVEGGAYFRSGLVGGIKFEDEKGDFKWYGKAFGEYVLLGDIPKYNMQFANGYGSMKDIEGREIIVLVGLGLGMEYKIDDRLGVFADFGTNFAIDYFAYNINLGLNYRFGDIYDKTIKKPQEEDKPEFEDYRPLNLRTFRLLAAWFDTGKYNLTAQAKGMIKDAADDIKKFTYRKITIEGHADSTGDEGKNKSLSIMRARAVYEELYNNGIPLDKMEYIEFFGSEEAVAPNATVEGRARNRRAEIVIDYVLDEKARIREIEDEEKGAADKKARNKLRGASSEDEIGEFIDMPDRTRIIEAPAPIENRSIIRKTPSRSKDKTQESETYTDPQEEAIRQEIERQRRGGVYKADPIKPRVVDVDKLIQVSQEAAQETKNQPKPSKAAIQKSAGGKQSDAVKTAPKSIPAEELEIEEIQFDEKEIHLDDLQLDIFDMETDSEL
ncbi:MAG: OmpA family protein [Elusimicrobiota bacterium]|jgi:autotransporter-associated beta strand protein/predicted outer membrane repeat protein|nr:OmpA family protein [Elusimicrobiota bacterium]